MSKEVEEAINVVKNDIYDLKGFLTESEKIKWQKAIETVLNYIKELEEEKDKLKEGLVKRITYCNELEKDLFENCENYVVNKSKIRDKIEELEKQRDNVKIFKNIDEYDRCIGKIQVLKELLEEE